MVHECTWKGAWKFACTFTSVVDECTWKFPDTLTPMAHETTCKGILKFPCTLTCVVHESTWERYFEILHVPLKVQSGV